MIKNIMQVQTTMAQNKVIIKIELNNKCSGLNESFKSTILKDHKVTIFQTYLTCNHYLNTD